MPLRMPPGCIRTRPSRVLYRGRRLVSVRARLHKLNNLRGSDERPRRGKSWLHRSCSRPSAAGGGRAVNAVPRLSIGLPVYNGEKYLAEALEALLGQSYEDFELVISDNASTDGTAAICRRYEKQDSRVRYVRQARNIGLVPNHNFVVGQARGELFKWAAHDDLYGRDLLKRCVDTLDENPQAVLAQAWSVIIDDSAAPIRLIKYPEATASPRAPERFRSMLFDGKRDYIYGVVRTDVLRQTPLHGSYHMPTRPWSLKSRCTGRATRSRIGCSSGVNVPARSWRCATGVRSWTPAGRTGYGTRLYACMRNISGGSSRRSVVRLYRPRSGGSVISTWRGGWPTARSRRASNRTSRFLNSSLSSTSRGG